MGPASRLFTGWCRYLLQCSSWLYSKYVNSRHSLIHVLKSGRDIENGISSYRVFCTSMAARVGTGNMVDALRLH